MEKGHTTTSLKQLILEKEAEHQAEGKLLKEHFHLAYESVKPINIIKNTIKEAIYSPDLKSNVINATIGLSAGFVAKKIFTWESQNPLTKLLGIILEIVVASKVTKNADEIKSIAGIMLKKLINKYSHTEKTGA